MNSNQRVQLVLELLEGKLTAAQLAQQNGISEEELLAWRDTWLAGARATNKSRVPSRRMLIVGGLAGVVLLGLVSREALAATCAAPANFTSLGLRYFCPNDPALASEVNANTSQLVSLMQQKLGGTWGAADAGPGTTAIATGPATITGTATVTGASTLTGGAAIGSTSNISFGSQVRQMLNLYGVQYGIGVQASTLYMRSGGNFAWYVGGTHSDTAFDPGGGVEAMRLTANGALSVRGLKQVNGGALAVAPAELQRLIVEAGPAVVGVAVPIDHSALTAMCADDDGCQLTISMVNWNNDGNVSSRSQHFYMSQTGSGTWRLENDVEGTDGNGAVTEWSAWDCYFGDFNYSSNTDNGRLDTGVGFGLLNCKGGGCAYSDTAMTCRMTFRD
jgi:hypothetical protein